ncbi:uncharacterized protein LDX57_001715 [Aspergillus melleus]|uniref:uncharacterized protein n=1 Tax=Aspergillus melleus TaxID=138277 RepID=UPI001E8D8687|nr:uncharacterized protein LDX57_001715 [Aspergillus melleus]KAH8423959.1 hypothetical protein LDX57_001715 [Aspergillus melleus]
MISKLVLHEPVIPSLLPPHELAQKRALVDEVLDAFSKSGPAAANKILMPHVSTKRDLALLKQEPVLQELAALPPDRSNVYFATELPALVQYEVDIVSLVAGADRVILAHGEPPSVPLSYYPLRRLGDILEKPLVDFPGGHNGYVTHPKDFAIKLIDALRPLRHKL